MFSHLCLFFLSWLLSLVAIDLAFANTVSINSQYDVSDPRVQIFTGTRGSFTATVGSWNHSASALGASGTSNCACDQGTASGTENLGACALCLSAAPMAPGSSRRVIGLTITGSRQSQLSTPGPHFPISSRRNWSFEARTGSLYRYSTPAPPSPTAPRTDLASGISDETRQAVSTGVTPSSPTFRRNSSSNIWGNTLGRLPTAATPSSLTQHATNTSRPIQGTQPLLPGIDPLSTSAIASNKSPLAYLVVTTDALNGSSSSMTFTASGVAALGSIIPYNSSVPTLGTGSLKYASETLRSRPSLRANSSTQESFQSTRSQPSASSIAISSTNIASLSSPKANYSARSTRRTDLVPSVPSLTLSHNTTGLPYSVSTLSRMPFATSINLSSNYSQHSSPAAISSSSALTVIPVSNTNLTTQQSQASPGSTSQNPSFTTTTSTGQSSTAITSPSSLNAYAIVSSLLTLVTPTVETLPVVETKASGFRTTVDVPVTIGAGGVVIPPPIGPIGGLFPGLGGGGGSGPDGGSGDEPTEPQVSRSQTLNTQPSNLPGSTTQTLTPPASSTLTSNTPPSSTIASSTLFSSTLISSTLSRSSLSLSTLASSAQISTTSCSSCDVCPTFDYNPTATPNALDNVDDVMKRQLGGRFYNAKRAGSGNEVVTTLVAGKTCAVSRYTQKPAYPGPASVANNEPPATPAPNMVSFYATATYWAVPTQPPQGSCGAPGWTFFDTQQIASYQVKGRPAPWALGGSKKSVNVSCNAVVEFTSMVLIFKGCRLTMSTKSVCWTNFSLHKPLQGQGSLATTLLLCSMCLMWGELGQGSIPFSHNYRPMTILIS